MNPTSTNLPDAMDPPRTIDATTTYDVEYMMGVDAQIQGLSRHVVAERNAPYACVFPLIDPDGDDIPQGYGVGIPPSDGPGGVALAVLFTDDVRLNGGVYLGIAAQTIPKGTRGPVAVAGYLPSSITGLSAAANGYACLDLDTARIISRPTTSLLFPVGLCNADGSVILTGSPTSLAADETGTSVVQGALLVEGGQISFPPFQAGIGPNAPTADLPTGGLSVFSGPPFSGATGTHRNSGNFAFGTPAEVSGGVPGSVDCYAGEVHMTTVTKAVVGLCCPNNAPSVGGGVNICFLGDQTTPPSSNPTGGICMSSAAGKLSLYHPAGVGTKTTVGAAGAASALPATPTKYLQVVIDGTAYAIPLYNP